MSAILALQNSDEKIFQEVFNQYHRKVYANTLSRTGSEYLAEEVVQITFIKLWQYRSSLSTAYALSTQIFKIANTTLIDQLRKQNNLAKIETGIDPGQTATSNNVFDKIDNKETKSRVLTAIMQLSKIRRQTFEMSRFDGLSHKEIAMRLSISEKAVENHIYKATRQLRKILSAEVPLITTIAGLLFYN